MSDRDVGGIWAPGETLAPTLARLVRPEWATRVVSPASDALGPDRRRALMDEDPLVFLHVTRSPEDFEGRLSAEEVLARNADALRRLLDADVYGALEGPGIWLYRLRTDDHEQTAVVGDVPLAAFDAGRLLPHERIRPHRASLLSAHLALTGYASSPVATTYHADPVVDAIVGAACEAAPQLDFARGGGLRQTIWRVDDAAAEELVARIAPRTQYIVDGHHRVSAALENRQAHGGRPGRHQFVLGAAFPHDQLRVAAFHRRSSWRNGFTTAGLLDHLADRFDIDELDAAGPHQPDAQGVITAYTEGRWFRLADPHPDEHVLDTVLLQEEILGPILDVDEAGHDDHLEYAPGDPGLERLVARCDADGGVAFALHPITVEQMMDLVDRGATLPPKSTYFEPKVRSGVFLVPR
jgi:uncharacterized protein (DUF1015 family)